MPSKNHKTGRKSRPAAHVPRPQNNHPTDRETFLHLFLQQLPALDRFVRHTVRHAEQTGAAERGLVDPCAIIDQVYIAALADLKKIPAQKTFDQWLRYLALHIARQQIRLEHSAEPLGLTLERPLQENGNVDSDLWEFYQPDDVVSVEDVVNDRSALDPAQLLERRETESEIERWIDELPPELREALRLRLFEGLNATEIAALKNRSMDDIRQAIRDACAVVRERASQASA
jgi:RNA polymerase sigma factor (sigma-70 family)